MNKNKISVLVGLLLLFVAINAQAQMASIIIYEELEVVYPRENKVVINGRILSFKESTKESSYRSAEAAKTLERLSQLKVGEKYYFEVVARGKDIQKRNFNEVIFISKSKPLE